MASAFQGRKGPSSLRNKDAPPVVFDTVLTGMNQLANPPPDWWLTEQEFADLLRISLRHLINLRKAGLSHLMLGAVVRYALRFPELAREAVRQGAEVLAYMDAWPVKRHQYWITLLQARAIENQAYVIGVNRTGSDDARENRGRGPLVYPHRN